MAGDLTMNAVKIEPSVRYGRIELAFNAARWALHVKSSNDRVWPNTNRSMPQATFIDPCPKLPSQASCCQTTVFLLSN